MRNNLIMTRAYFFAALVAMLSGCQPKENKAQLKAINESLERSNDVIKNAARRMLMEMEDKLHQPVYGGRVTLWVSIMKKIQANTDTLIGTIENFKHEVVKQTNNLKLDNVDVLTSLHEPKGSGYSLLKKLATFKDNIPAIFNDFDSLGYPNQYATLKADSKNLRKAGPLLPDYAEGLNEEQRNGYINNWLDKNLRGSSALMTMVVLNKLKNDILNTSAMLMDHCSFQVGMVDGPGFYTRYSAIAVLNSSYVKRGQTIEVMAGMGEFSFSRKPRVTINGNEVKLDEDAIAVHRFKADGKPGKHSLIVKIEFTNTFGTPTYVSKKLEYEIANEK
jgi:hypothetical protein